MGEKTLRMYGLLGWKAKIGACKKHIVRLLLDLLPIMVVQKLKNNSWKIMKIGIVTIYNVPNYGAILQTYSLVEYLRREGHEVVLFNVDSPKLHPYIYKLKRLFKLGFIDRFQRRHYPTITSNLNEEVDIYMVGSDQVWNIEITQADYDKYFLAFALHNRKVSYAASFGNNEWDFPSKRNEIRGLLSVFKYITVREEIGVNILKFEFNMKGNCVLDPCFLLDGNDFLFGKIIESKKYWYRIN